jgi:predicted nucleic acid-binding protein
MKPVFLDTGYLIALEASDDQNHRAARTHWKNFYRHLPPLISTSLVFAEVVTFFNCRGHHTKAIEIGNRLLASTGLELVQVDEVLLSQAWEYFQNHSDKTFSLTDCVSFRVMEQRGIEVALSFDRHFTQAGFNKLP